MDADKRKLDKFGLDGTARRSWSFLRRSSTRTQAREQCGSHERPRCAPGVCAKLKQAASLLRHHFAHEREQRRAEGAASDSDRHKTCNQRARTMRESDARERNREEATPAAATHAWALNRSPRRPEIGIARAVLTGMHPIRNPEVP